MSKRKAKDILREDSDCMLPPVTGFRTVELKVTNSSITSNAAEADDSNRKKPTTRNPGQNFGARVKKKWIDQSGLEILSGKAKKARDSSIKDLQLENNTVIIDDIPDLSNMSKVDVEYVEEVNGLGVLLKAKETLRPGDIAAEYAGIPRWVTSEERAVLPRGNVYVYDVGPFYVNGMVYYISWDGKPYSRDWELDKVGHLLNTCHPQLPGKYMMSNCCFGIYFGPDFTASTHCVPDVRLFIIATTHLHSTCKKRVELLVDYHWQLVNGFGYICGDFECVHCYIELRFFLSRWTTRLREKNIRLHIAQDYPNNTPSLPRIHFDPSIPEPCERPWDKYLPITPDDFFKRFHMTTIKRDGNCMFRALALGYYDNSSSRWKDVKKNMLTYFEQHVDTEMRILDTSVGDCNNKIYLADGPLLKQKLLYDGSWGNNDSLMMFMAAFNVPVYVWREPDTSVVLSDIAAAQEHTLASPTHYVNFSGPDPWKFPSGPSKKTIHLLWTGNDHYNFLKPNKMYVSNLSRTRTPSVIDEESESLSSLSDSEQQILTAELLKSRSIQLFSTPEKLDIQSSSRPGLSRTNSVSSTQSVRSSNTSQRGTPKSHEQVRHELLTYNISKELRKYMKSNHCCCGEQCVYRDYPDNEEWSCNLHSQIWNKGIIDTRAVMDQCRRTSADHSRLSFSRWLEERLRHGMHFLQGTDCPTWTFEVRYRLSNGQEMIQPVCKTAFQLFYGVNRQILWRAMQRVHVSRLTNVSARAIKKISRTLLQEQENELPLTPREAECVNFIRIYCRRNGEHMPNSEETRISYTRKVVFEAYQSQYSSSAVNVTNVRNGKNVSISLFYDLWNRHCANIVNIHGKEGFAICDQCKEFQYKDHNSDLSNEAKTANRMGWSSHLATINQCRLGYYNRRELSIRSPNEFISLIVDGSDSSNTYLPVLGGRLSKSEQSCSKAFIKHKLMAVRIHAWNKRDYVYLQAPWGAKGSGCNLTIEAIARTLAHEADLRSKDPTMRWPSKLFVQMDNTSRDNKNHYVFGYLSMLVQRGIFREVDVNFLPVGHTHEDIDQLFSVVNRQMRSNSSFTFPQWEKQVKNAYKLDTEKIYRVEYLTAIHDYKKWLEDISQNAYTEYRSKVYHFRIYKNIEEEQSKVSCKYLRYDYHEFWEGERYGYMPYFEKPQTWLKGIVVGSPQLDESAGSWRDLDLNNNDCPVDTNVILSSMSDLFALRSNSARTEDFIWWTNLMSSLDKGPQVAASGGHMWTYTDVDPEEVNKDCSFESIDIYHMSNVGPVKPPNADLLLFTNFSRTHRELMHRIADQTVNILETIQVEVGDMVVFAVDESFRLLGREQQGMSERATSLPFGLGKVVDRQKSRDRINHQTSEPCEEEDVADPIFVQIYYQPEGNPKKTWQMWTLQSNTSTAKNPPWIKAIPRQSIYTVCTDKMFKSGKGRFVKMFTAEGLKELSNTPRFPMSYIPSHDHGLVDSEVATAFLQARVDQINNRSSIEGKRKYNREKTNLDSHKRLAKAKQAYVERAILAAAESQPPQTVSTTNAEDA